MPRTHKSNRSLAKRIKVTASGKTTKRKAGQSHFNAKDSGITGERKHHDQVTPKAYNKSFQALLPARKIAS